MSKVVGYPQGQGLNSGSVTSQTPLPVAQNVLDVTAGVPVTANTNPLTGWIRSLNASGVEIPLFRQSDSGLDYVAYGLTLPTSGTIGIAAIAAGVAYVSGYRIAHAGSVLALEATKDHYIDLDYNGNVIVSAVTVAAAAPAKAANSIRLGYVTTNATSVTAAVTGAMDSNGVWMGNVSEQPHCRLALTALTGTGGGSEYAVSFGAGTTKEQNDGGMHSESTNTSRLICTKAGVYNVWGNINLNAAGAGGSWTMRILKNGSSATLGQAKGLDTSCLSLQISHTMYLQVGDYITLAQQTATNLTMLIATFGMTRLG